MITIPVDTIIPDAVAVDRFCQHLLDNKTSDRIFLTALWETYLPSNEFIKIDKFANDNHISISWVINSWGQNHPGWKEFKNKIIFFDFFLWRVYNEIFIKRKNGVNLKWNYLSKKYLFLTGKPDKQQRIGLLHLLQSHNVLDNCIYSFFINDGMAKASRWLLPSLSDAEYQKFITERQSNPDNISITEQDSSLHYGGFPYDHELYVESKFRVISETSMETSITAPMIDARPWITEKTWITIANKVPFIIAGDHQSCKYLNQLGINTFDNIVTVDSYDDIESIEKRLHTIVEHIKCWINNDFICNTNLIDAQVEHNFDQFCKLAVAEKNNFEICTEFNIDQVIDTRDDMTKF